MQRRGQSCEQKGGLWDAAYVNKVSSLEFEPFSKHEIEFWEGSLFPLKGGLRKWRHFKEKEEMGNSCSVLTLSKTEKLVHSLLSDYYWTLLILKLTFPWLSFLSWLGPRIWKWLLPLSCHEPLAALLKSRTLEIPFSVFTLAWGSCNTKTLRTEFKPHPFLNHLTSSV